MSTSLAPQAIPAVLPSAKAVKSWLVGPWFDLVFLANLAWPIAVFLTFVRPLDDGSSLSIFQVYFLWTPHRWITLVLVFCDSDRFWKEPAKFGSLGIGLLLLGLALVGIAGLVPFAANSLMLLMMLDYIWNAWHFASQHAGISRIYGRMTRSEQTADHAEFEKMAIRTLVLWVFFRFAIHLGEASEYGERVRWLPEWLQWLDPLFFIPVIVLLRARSAHFARNAGGVCFTWEA